MQSDTVYTVYKNIYKLIEYRGYNPETNPWVSKTEFLNAFKKHDPMIISGTSKTDLHRGIKVMLIQNKDNLSKQKFTNIVSNHTTNDDDIIVVFEKPIKASSNNALTEAEKNRSPTSGNKIWYMTYDHLKTVIPESNYIAGSLRIMNQAESEEIIKLNRKPLDSYPKIMEYDSTGLWYGIKKGDLLEYAGPSETGGLVVRYYYTIAQNRYQAK